jgi:hypothetical protein
MEENPRAMDMSDKRAAREFISRSGVEELAAYCALGVACWVGTWIFIGGGAFEEYAILALAVCLASCVGSLVWQFGHKNIAQSDLSILLTMGFRFSVLLGALAISTATKWQHHNSFCNCLLGYYFPFLLLQSALLIRNQSFSNPPQS